MATSTLTYAQPYISIQIFDNTEFVESDASETRKDFTGMQVGFFAGGRDNQLLYMNSQYAYLREYGAPNFKKYGQAAYNADNALATNNCGMYIMNLRPNTATYANVVIMIKFRLVKEEKTITTDSEGKETTEVTYTTISLEDAKGVVEGETQDYIGTGEYDDENYVAPKHITKIKLAYAFYAKNLESANSEEKFTEDVINLINDSPDENGYYNMPFIAFRSLGRGEYGNNIHLVFSNVTEYINEDNFYDQVKPKFHTYSLTVAESSPDGLIKREVMYGNFAEDGFDANFPYGPSTFFDDVTNDVETGSQRIHTETIGSTLDIICNLFNEAFKPTEKMDQLNLDLLSRLDLDGKEVTRLMIDPELENFNLFSIDGFTMDNGSDGWDGMTEAQIGDVKEKLLIKAFSGDIDPVIMSRFSSPCNFCLDANYSLNVKKHMAALANRRKYDLMTYLDMGLNSTTSALISALTNLKDVYGYNIVKEGHNYKWRDRTYTGKLCDMTITHWLGAALANHMGSVDKNLFVPMARDTAILKSGIDYIPGSFKPVIDPDADDIKNTIYRLRGNCYETLTYNSVQRSTAITSCQSKSDRLVEMNEYILQKAVKCVYECLASKLYKLGEASDRAQYEEDATDIVEAQIKDYVRSVKVTLEMTPADEKKSLLRIKLRLVFKTIIQSGAIEIYLDPRVTDSETKTTITSSYDDDEDYFYNSYV